MFKRRIRQLLHTINNALPQLTIIFDSGLFILHNIIFVSTKNVIYRNSKVISQLF